MIWIENKISRSVSVQTLISIPKRNIKLASKRNILKRRINEAFRVNKIHLYTKLDETNKQINIAVIYQHGEILAYKLIEEKIKLLLSRLIKEL